MFKPKYYRIYGAIAILSMLVGTTSILILFNTPHPVSADSQPPFGNTGGGDWLKKQEIQVDPDKVSGLFNLSDFPVLLTEANVDSSIFTDAQEDGCDLRASTNSDGSTEIPIEVANFSTTSSKMEIYVKRTLSHDTTTSIWLWWGNSSAACYSSSDTYGSQNVWDSNFKLVYHLGENVNNNAGGYADSTVNTNTASGTSMSEPAVSAKAGLGQSFAGDPDRIVSESNIGVSGSSSRTTSLWVYLDQNANYQYLYSQGDGGNGEAWGIYLTSDGSWYVHGENSDLDSNDNLSTGTWYYISVTYDGTTVRTYQNGSAKNSGTKSYNTDNTPLNLATKFQLNSYLDGKLDEVRYSNIARSADWITTEYNNMNDPSTFAYEQTLQNVNVAPSAPSHLKVEGQSNPGKVTDSIPEFYTVYIDQDTGDTAVHYQIQVATSSSYWAAPEWDSSKTSMASTTVGNRCPSIAYGGIDAMAFDGATYYWRIKFWDEEDNEGSWSDGTDFFTMASAVKVEFP